MLYHLSIVLNDDYVVELKSVLVGVQHLEMVRKSYPDAEVGHEIQIISILSTTHYKRGYRPTNREVFELQDTLGCKPLWLEEAMP